MLVHSLQELLPGPNIVVREMGEQLLRQLTEKLHTLQSMSMYLAILLDPRFKILRFLSPTKASEAIRGLTYECAAVI